MDKLVKLSIATGTLGGTAGLVYVVQQQLTTNGKDSKLTQEPPTSTKKVSENLLQKGHTLLNYEDNGDLTTWKKLAKAYSEGTNKLGDLRINKPTVSAEATEEDAKNLRASCKSAINSTDDIIKSAEQWCVEPISVEKLVTKHRTVLQLEDSKDENVAEWDSKVANFVQSNAENKIDGATLVSASSDKVADRKKLKSDCRKIKDKLTHDKDFHSNYKQFETWCTIPK